MKKIFPAALFFLAIAGLSHAEQNPGGNQTASELKSPTKTPHKKVKVKMKAIKPIVPVRHAIIHPLHIMVSPNYNINQKLNEYNRNQAILQTTGESGIR